MKTAKQKLTILAAVLLLLSGSCEMDEGIDLPYYKFDEKDIALMPKFEYEVGQIITYKNQFDEELNFKVIQNEIKRGGYSSFQSFSGGGVVDSYHDIKIIRFEIVENENYASEGLVNYIFSKSRDTLTNGINFPLWNVFAATLIDELQNPVNIFLTELNDTEKTKVNINGHLFERVIVVDSQSEDINDNSGYGTLTSNVNKVYYDYDFGIIQFDDLDGKEWKLIYPE